MNIIKYLARMLIFVAVVGALVAYLLPQLEIIYFMNIPLNSMIFAVLIFGVVITFRQVLVLRPEIHWMNLRRRGRPEAKEKFPKILITVFNVMSDKKKPVISPAMQQTLLDGIACRLDESRETARYVIGVLIFLGLLGTFWGLSITLHSIAGVISGLPASAIDIGQFFAQLKTGLQSPLEGMGFAFSSSLFGLAGSLIIGFLELQAGQAASRFYNFVEEWLSSDMQLGPATKDSEVQADVGFTNVLLEQTAENLDNLSRIAGDNEIKFKEMTVSLSDVATQLKLIAEQQTLHKQTIEQLSANQEGLNQTIVKLNELVDKGKIGFDENSRSHLQNIAALTSKMIDAVEHSRKTTLTEVRGESRLIAKSIMALAKAMGIKSKEVTPAKA